MRHLLPLNARELKERIDLSDFASAYTRLRRSGRQLVGLCPIHSERHPSFYVHPQRQVWFCFGCNRGGDLFDFVMSVKCCNFRRALEITAEFSDRVARASEPRSGSRFGAGRGEAPRPAERGVLHSQSLQESRVRIVAALDATNRRLLAIEATNREASVVLATACEPERGSLYLLEETK
jgi:hypothetical protein